MIDRWVFWWEPPLGDLWATTLLHFLWQGIVVAAAHGLCLFWLQRSSAQWRYVCGVAWLFVLASCPIVTCGLLAATSADRARHTAAGPLPGGQVTSEAVEPVVSDGPDVAPGGESPPTWSIPRFRRQSIDWQRWFVGGWCLGVATLSLRLVGGGWLVWRLRREVQALPPEMASHVRILRRRLRISGAVVVAVSRHVTTAFACGLWRPMVLLPASWLVDMSPSMLQAVIAHELAHIRRYDLWVNLFQRVTETLWFYHPAVWWISMSIRRERETCCDELAVSILPSRVQYAETLEFLAVRRLAGTAPLWLSAGIGGRRMVLLKRIQHVLGTAAPRSAGAVWPIMCLVGLLTVGTTAVVRSAALAAAQAPAGDAAVLDARANVILDEPLHVDADVALTADEAESPRDQMRAMHRELREAQVRLREYERMMDEMKQELNRTRALFARQQRRIEMMEQSSADTRRDGGRPASPRARNVPRDTNSTRPRDRETVAHDAALQFERRMLDHRQESIEMQMQQAKERYQQQLELRLGNVKAEIKRQKRQHDMQAQMADLELKQQSLQHERQAREVARRMEEIKRQQEQATDDKERAGLERELESLQEDLVMMDAEQALARERCEFEAQARKADVESEVDAAFRRTKIDAEIALRAELQQMEMQLHELQLARERLEMQSRTGRTERERPFGGEPEREPQGPFGNPFGDPDDPFN